MPPNCKTPPRENSLRGAGFHFCMVNFNPIHRSVKDKFGKPRINSALFVNNS